MGKIRRLTIYTDKIKTLKKILVYSDLHLGFKDPNNVQRIFTIPELDASNYNYILIPGDIIHTASSLEIPRRRQDIIDTLGAITKSTKTFVSIGNHDQYHRLGFEKWSPYSSAIFNDTINKIDNFKLLNNGETINEGNLSFAAINNSMSYYLNNHEQQEDFNHEIESISPDSIFEPDSYNIFLSHDPKSIYHLSKKQGKCCVKNADLVISGHMHNGFVPNFLHPYMHNYGFVSPDYRFFPDFAYGTKEIEDTIFLVNGAANTFIEFPILNKISGLNCSIVELYPSSSPKRLTYTYK